MMKVGVLNKIATKLDDTTNALHKYYTTAPTLHSKISLCTTVHVQIRWKSNDLWNGILIGFVVITLCFIFKSAVSSVGMDIFVCDYNFISKNTTGWLPVTTGFLVKKLISNYDFQICSKFNSSDKLVIFLSKQSMKEIVKAMSLNCICNRAQKIHYCQNL